MQNLKAEEARIRYLYRESILKRLIRLSHDAAVALVGPDCAYHLYSLAEYSGESDRGRQALKQDTNKLT